MAQKQNRADGPSGFVGFEDVYGANAGAAKASADKLTADFTNAATGAQDALQKAYGNFQSGGNEGTFEPGDDVTAQYGKVLGMRNALTGTGQPGGPTATGGIQALLGGGATDMDAMFARRAGGNFESIKSQYANIGDDIGRKQRESAPKEKEKMGAPSANAVRPLGWKPEDDAQGPQVGQALNDPAKKAYTDLQYANPSGQGQLQQNGFDPSPTEKYSNTFIPDDQKGG